MVKISQLYYRIDIFSVFDFTLSIVCTCYIFHIQLRSIIFLISNVPTIKLIFNLQYTFNILLNSDRIILFFAKLSSFSYFQDVVKADVLRFKCFRI